MKRSFTTFCLSLFAMACGISIVSAQNSMAPSPNWLNKTKDNEKYVFSHGEGYGINEEEASLKAQIDGQKGFIFKLRGLEFDEQVTSDILKSVINRENIRFARGRTYTIRTDDGVKVYILFKATKLPDVLLDNIPVDDTFDKRVEDYYKSLEVPTPQKPLRWAPIGLKQLQRDRTPWEKTRGSIWFIGQTAGLAGTVVFSCRWASQQNDLNKLRKAYDNEPYGDARVQIQNQIHNKENHIQDSKLGFGLSIGTMALFYGLNVIDNCVWTKANKQGIQASLHLTPSFTPEYNGIGLTFTF